MKTIRKMASAVAFCAAGALADDFDNKKVLTLSPQSENQIRFQIVGDPVNWWMVDGKSGPAHLGRIWDVLHTSLVKGCPIWFSTDGTLKVVAVALRNACAYH